MDGNIYLIEIIYIIFYAFLILFIYFNYVAITNFSESYKIIVENASPQCLPNPQKLPFISESDLIPCTFEANKDKFYYYNQNNNLAFIVSNNQEDAGNFLKLCSKYCPGGKIDKTHKCTATNKGTYEKCIQLLQPPPKCTNSSVAIAIDKTNESFFYAEKFANEHSGTPC